MSLASPPPAAWGSGAGMGVDGEFRSAPACLSLWLIEEDLMQAREDCLKPERPHAGATNAQNVVCIAATRCLGLAAGVPRVLPAISPHRAHFVARGGGPESPPPAAWGLQPECRGSCRRSHPTVLTSLRAAGAPNRRHPLLGARSQSAAAGGYRMRIKNRS
jgi:hypothetical protein